MEKGEQLGTWRRPTTVGSPMGWLQTGKMLILHQGEGIILATSLG